MHCFWWDTRIRTLYKTQYGWRIFVFAGFFFSWLWSSVWSSCCASCSRFWKPMRLTGNMSCASFPLCWFTTHLPSWLWKVNGQQAIKYHLSERLYRNRMCFRWGIKVSVSAPLNSSCCIGQNFCPGCWRLRLMAMTWRTWSRHFYWHDRVPWRDPASSLATLTGSRLDTRPAPNMFSM